LVDPRLYFTRTDRRMGVRFLFSAPIFRSFAYPGPIGSLVAPVIHFSDLCPGCLVPDISHESPLWTGFPPISFSGFYRSGNLGSMGNLPAIWGAIDPAHVVVFHKSHAIVLSGFP